jgi:hypothetical protein
LDEKSKRIVELLHNNFAIKTTSRDQAANLLKLIKIGGGLGINYFVDYGEVKRGTIFGLVDNALVYTREVERFASQKIINFKDIK